MTTKAYIRGVKEEGRPSFEKRLWQRGYYEHVVRGEEELKRVRQHVLDNPTKRPLDPENPLLPRNLLSSWRAPTETGSRPSV